MTITSRDQLIDAMGNRSSRFILDKASIASQAAGSYVSMWRATGQPGQGGGQPDPMKTSVGDIGADSLSRQRQGQKRGNGGGGGKRGGRP